jgi:hypothetical protein
MSKSRVPDSDDESLPFFYELDYNQQTAILEQSSQIVSKLQASKSRQRLEPTFDLAARVPSQLFLNHR